MTRRELLATVAAVPAAVVEPLKPTIKPYWRVTIDYKDIGPWVKDYPAMPVSFNATMKHGDTFAVESSEHGAITYKHVGAPGVAEYFWDGEFGYILGPPRPDGWFNLELKHKDDAS